MRPDVPGVSFIGWGVSSRDRRACPGFYSQIVLDKLTSLFRTKRGEIQHRMCCQTIERTGLYKARRAALCLATGVTRGSEEKGVEPVRAALRPPSLCALAPP